MTVLKEARAKKVFKNGRWVLEAGPGTKEFRLIAEAKRLWKQWGLLREGWRGPREDFTPVREPITEERLMREAAKTEAMARLVEAKEAELADLHERAAADLTHTVLLHELGPEVIREGMVSARGRRVIEEVRAEGLDPALVPMKGSRRLLEAQADSSHGALLRGRRRLTEPEDPMRQHPAAVAMDDQLDANIKAAEASGDTERVKRLVALRMRQRLASNIAVGITAAAGSMADRRNDAGGGRASGKYVQGVGYVGDDGASTGYPTADGYPELAPETPEDRRQADIAQMVDEAEDGEPEYLNEDGEPWEEGDGPKYLRNEEGELYEVFEAIDHSHVIEPEDEQEHGGGGAAAGDAAGDAPVRKPSHRKAIGAVDEAMLREDWAQFDDQRARDAFQRTGHGRGLYVVHHGKPSPMGHGLARVRGFADRDHAMAFQQAMHDMGHGAGWDAKDGRYFVNVLHSGVKAAESLTREVAAAAVDDVGAHHSY